MRKQRTSEWVLSYIYTHTISSQTVIILDVAKSV